MTLDYVLRKSLSRDPYCFRAWRKGEGYVIDGSNLQDREEYLRQYKQAAIAEIENMGFSSAYAEPGYDQPKNGVLLANWNVLARGLDDILEKMGYAVEWSDEWSFCDNCCKCFRTQPDHLGWEPSYQEIDGELLCRECTRHQESFEMTELMRLLHIPRNIADITRTSDGFFLARPVGDIAYNVFLGKPSFHPGPGKDRSREVWAQLTFTQRKAAVRQSRTFGLSLSDMLR